MLKKKKRFLICLVLSFVLLFASTPVWAAYTDKTALLNFCNGDGYLTRAEFGAMLLYARDKSTNSDPLAALQKEGVIKGYPDGSLGGERAVSFQEALVMTGRSLGLVEDASLPTAYVKPAEMPSWVAPFYAWLSECGLIEKERALDKSLTEEEGALFLSKVFTTSKEAQEIIEKSVAAQTGVSLAKYEAALNMLAKIRILPSSETQNSTALNLEMEMDIKQESNLPDVIHQTLTFELKGMPETIAPVTIEQYIVYGEEGWIYQKMTDPQTGEESWQKIPFNFDLEQFMKEIENMPSGGNIPPELEAYILAKYQLVETTEIEGEQVYRLASYGYIDDLNGLVQALAEGFGENNESLLPPDATEGLEILNGIKISFWTIEDLKQENYQPINLETEMVINFPQELQKELGLKFIEINFIADKIELKANPDLIITIPKEALDAPVIETSPAIVP